MTSQKLCDYDQFAASVGWLQKLNILSPTGNQVIWGESANIEGDCSSWKRMFYSAILTTHLLFSCLQECTRNYIFNTYKIGVFFKYFPNKTLPFHNVKFFAEKYSNSWYKQGWTVSNEKPLYFTEVKIFKNGLSF